MGDEQCQIDSIATECISSLLLSLHAVRQPQYSSFPHLARICQSPGMSNTPVLQGIMAQPPQILSTTPLQLKTTPAPVPPLAHSVPGTALVPPATQSWSFPTAVQVQLAEPEDYWPPPPPVGCSRSAPLQLLYYLPPLTLVDYATADPLLPLYNSTPQGTPIQSAVGPTRTTYNVPMSYQSYREPDTSQHVPRRLHPTAYQSYAAPPPEAPDSRSTSLPPAVTVPNVTEMAIAS